MRFQILWREIARVAVAGIGTEEALTTLAEALALTGWAEHELFGQIHLTHSLVLDKSERFLINVAQIGMQI